MSRQKNNKTKQKQIANRLRVRRFRLSRKVTEAQLMEDRDECDFSDVSQFEVLSNKPVRELLRSWVNFFGISVRAVNALLQILILAGNLDIYIYISIYCSS